MGNVLPESGKSERSPGRSSPHGLWPLWMANKTTVPQPPWDLSGTAPRFAGHRVAFSGKFEVIRKKDVIEMLEKEGATIDAKLGGATSLLVCAQEGSANHTRAQALQGKGMPIAVATEDEFRQRYLVPSADQVVDMLAKAKDRKRLARLLELAREAYSRGTDEHSSVEVSKRELAGADLGKAELHGVHFVECDLQGAKLDGTKLSEAERTDFRKATGNKCDLVELRECDLREADLDKAELGELEDCRLEGAKLPGLRLHGDIASCRFDDSTLDGMRMAYGDVRESSFAKASLTGATLESVDFEDCSFTGADFRKATLKGASSSLTMVGCDLSGADFRDATLTQVRLERCKLDGAKFAGAKISGLELVETDGSTASGLDATPHKVGPAAKALAEVAPTFKKIHVSVKLRLGKKKVDCELYMFDHGEFTAGLQAWLDGDNVGALQIHEAIATIGRLHPDAKLVDDTLVVKSSKGKQPPALKPKQLTQAVLDAWNEALS